MNYSKDELKYITVSNAKSSIKIALQGGHIFDFRCKGKPPLLFLSETARFKKGVPIRGGVPICWPWFGAHPTNKSLPNHGFARTSLWTHVQTQELTNEKTKIIMSLESSSQTLKIWPFEFELLLEIIISDTLDISLISKNTGTQSFPLTQALHTYLFIEDIQHVSLEGLETKPFYNKLDNTYNNIQVGSLQFTKEVDRVYENCNKTLLLKDINQKISVETQGSQTVVVWNPGKDYANNFSDLSDYKSMLCIESANALRDEVELHTNEVHILKSIISQY